MPEHSSSFFVIVWQSLDNFFGEFFSLLASFAFVQCTQKNRKTLFVLVGFVFSLHQAGCLACKGDLLTSGMYLSVHQTTVTTNSVQTSDLQSAGCIWYITFRFGATCTQPSPKKEQPRPPCCTQPSQ